MVITFERNVDNLSKWYDTISLVGESLSNGERMKRRDDKQRDKMRGQGDKGTSKQGGR